MFQELIMKEIDQLLNRITEQQEKLNQLQGKIPAIELDLEMKLVLDLYELLNKLKGISSDVATFSGNTNIVASQAGVVETDDSEIYNLMEKEQGSLSEQINIMIEMEKEEVVRLNTAQENKRVEIFKESQNVVVKEVKTAVEATVMMQPAQPIRQSQKPMAELFDELPTVAKPYTGKETLHEKMSSGKKEKSVATSLQSKTLSDLKKSIGMNERFVFVKELFNGDQKLYNQSIEQLNNFSTYVEAGNLFESLATQMNWNKQSKEFAELSELIRRRFNG